jgi:transposase-like protein
MALDAFADSDPGRRCPAAVQVLRRAWTEFIPFLELPAEIRRVVYTTNAIESMNYQLRKVTKNRGQFPSDEAAYKLLYLAICDIEARTTSRGAGTDKKLLMRGAASQHWTAALNQSSCTFPGACPRELKTPSRPFTQPT